MPVATANGKKFTFEEGTPKEEMFMYIDSYFANEAAQAPEEEASWTDNPLQAARAGLQGLTLNAGDELGAGVAAVAAKISGDDKSIFDIYDDIHGTLAGQRKEYAEQHPTAATALEVGGALASPANWIAPQAGFAQNVARAGVEGAVAGAAGADQGERGDGAAVGGLMGLGVGGALHGVGSAIQGASKRRVAQELGEGDDFVPFNVAAAGGDTRYENIMGAFYREIVGPSWGGGKIKVQENRILEPVSALRAKTEAALGKTKQNAKTSVAEAKKRIQDVKQSTIDAIKLKGSLTPRPETMPKAEALESAVRAVGDEAEKMRTAFRGRATVSALPEGASEDDILNVLKATSQNGALDTLEGVWGDVGFKTLNGKTFDIKTGALKKELFDSLKDDPLFHLEGVSKGDLQKLINDSVSFLDKKGAGGQVRGEDLSALRSRLGTLAASQSDAGGGSAVRQAIYSELQDVINKRIEKGLSGQDLTNFKAHREQWKNLILLRDATGAKSKGVGQGGDFTEDDWLSAIAKNSPREARQGQGPLRAQAEDVGKAFGKQQELVKDAQEKLLAASQIEKHNQLSMQKRAIAKEIKEVKRKAKSDTARSVKDKGRQNRIQELEDKLEAVTIQEKTLKEAMTLDHPSLFQRSFATGVMGTGYQIGNLISGTTMGRALSGERAQRAFAGQTATQNLLRNAEKTGQAARGLSTGAAAAAAGGLLGDG